MRRGLLGISGAALLITAMLLLGLGLPSNSSGNDGLHVELYVYKNGVLVYHDNDDPATKQLAGILVEIITGSGTFKSTDGMDFVKIADTNKPGYMFVSFDPSYTYTYGMNALPSSYASAQIVGNNVVFDDVNKAIQLAASITVSQNATIYGVGLYTTLGVVTAGNALYTKNVLLFYDPLDEPISVNQNDVVTVVYKIVLP